MAQITYANKVALNENPEIAAINKVSDDDMNEIKQVVNDNYNNTIQITDTQPTGDDWKLWIDTGEVQNVGSEITNEYSTSIGLGYSANYTNDLHTYSETEHRVGTWINGKPLYRKVINFGALPNNSEKIIAHNISNIDTMITVRAISTDGLQKFPIPFVASNFIYIFATNSNITIGDNSNRSTFTTTYVILEYTKTTD